MGNLGRYQDITTAAARAGGVEKLIKSIESNAVAKAAPRIIAKTVGGTVTVIALGATAVKRYSAHRLAVRLQSDDAKEQLKAVVDQPTVSDGPDASGSAPTIG